MATRTEPTYFSSAAAFQRWLNENSASSHELIVGFKKRRTSDPGMSWPEAVDEALCVGWVDGVRRRIDGERYQIRFTRRRPGSTWSALNIARVAFLQQQGRMKPAGLAAFADRAGQKSLAYSYKQEAVAVLGRLRKDLGKGTRPIVTIVRLTFPRAERGYSERATRHDQPCRILSEWRIRP
jgi:uncharacterized protein YdeI (YjbR/CyaY-like superfamily)